MHDHRDSRGLRRELDHCDSFRQFLDQKLRSCVTIGTPPGVDRIDLSLGLRRYAAHRIERLDLAIDEAVEHAPETLRAVIDALQALRGGASGVETAEPRRQHRLS